MTLTPTEIQFLDLGRVALSSETGLPKGSSVLPQGADYTALFDLARQQKLLPFLYEHLRHTPADAAHAELFGVAKQQTITQVLGQTMRSMQFSALYGLLRAAGLHPLVV